MKKAQSVPNMTDTPKRQLARNALMAVGAKAGEVTDSIKSSSYVFKFGIETAGRLLSPATSFTLNQWNHYGEPLLSQLDDTLDSTLNAIQEAASRNSAESSEQAQRDAQKQSYILYWESLKQKLVQSKWFAKVDEILLQNLLVKAVTSRISPLVRPAEVFFNTATEVFMSDGDTWEAFLEALKMRMGPAWDERLTSPARAFYTTSRTVKTIVGAGKFFGGAFQLGRQKLNDAIDDLISRWDTMVIRTDNAVDYLLPERKEAPEEHIENDTDLEEDAPVAELPPSAFSSSLRQASSDLDSPLHAPDAKHADSALMFEMDFDRAGSEVSAMDLTEPRAEVSEEEDAVVEEEFSLSSSSTAGIDAAAPSSPFSARGKRPRSVLPIAQKVSKRLRQRIPLVTELPAQLKARLLQSEWFQRVDEILRENVIVQMMQLQMMAVSALSQVVRPGEHFYNTAARVFIEHTRSCQDFLNHLRQAMGRAWDERLTRHAVAFFKSAYHLNAQQNAAAEAAATAAASLFFSAPASTSSADSSASVPALVSAESK